MLPARDASLAALEPTSTLLIVRCGRRRPRCGRGDQTAAVTVRTSSRVSVVIAARRTTSQHCLMPGTANMTRPAWTRRKRPFRTYPGCRLAGILPRMAGNPEELQRQIDALLAQGAQNHEGIADLERRTDALEVQATIDREMMIDLQAEGLLAAEHAAHLERALKSSRTIGAAIGLLMGSRDIDEDQAFALLKQVSQNTNRKLRELADELVHNANLLASRS